MYVGEGKVTDIIEWFRNNSSARFARSFRRRQPEVRQVHQWCLTQKSRHWRHFRIEDRPLFLFGTGRRINFLREKS